MEEYGVIRGKAKLDKYLDKWERRDLNNSAEESIYRR